MKLSVVWFRRDIRLLDNEAVARAVAHSSHCLFVFTLDPWFFTQPEIGMLRVRFLFESLAALDTQLRKYGNRLVILKGESVASITELLAALQQSGYSPGLYFNHDIQVAYGRTRDRTIEDYCQAHAVPCVITHNYFLLHEEMQMENWWKRYYDYQYDEPYAFPEIKSLAEDITRLISSMSRVDPQHIFESLDLPIPSPTHSLFRGGEHQAQFALYSFLKDRVDGYRWKISRPYLAQRGATSLLGPHMAFGTISSRIVFQTAVNHKNRVEATYPKRAFDIANYLDRLRWRDSFTQRLWFHPELIWKNDVEEFDAIYTDNPLDDKHQEYFERWKAGETGFPLLDAAMKQLACDGFINFRMRAMSATFLTINCGVSWHHGARYFMNYLVDGDIAINHWQWQMQAGITNPLSPTFRIYSPTKNLLDRDPRADYVHYWLPETTGMTADQILTASKPMLDFDATKRTHGKIVADLRATARKRLTDSHGPAYTRARMFERKMTHHDRVKADRYKPYLK